MENEVKEKLEVKKAKPKSLTVPMSKTAHRNLKSLQDQFKKNTGGSISLKKLGNRVFETATLPL